MARQRAEIAIEIERLEVRPGEGLMKLHRELFVRCVVVLVAIFAIFHANAAFAQATPAVVSSTGYIQGNAQTVHTTPAFSSIGATTLVAFVSSHPVWPQPGGLAVSISGVSDSAGNTWNTLTGPTQWDGSLFEQISAIYYVNIPITSATQTFTVNLTNPAPMVIDVFAVSGSDITGPPIFSAITDPGPGGVSASVTTESITVPNKSLLMSWVKNESDATATVTTPPWTLDPSSTSYLWAETQTG